MKPISALKLIIYPFLLLYLLIASDLDCSYCITEPERFVIVEFGQIYVMDLGSRFPYTTKAR